jgi:predicted nuclease of predicted toxin-antitoxin system
VSRLKLLFDQNLSPRLVLALGDLYPGSVHVRDVGLARADDGAVWEHAEKNALTIVSKDGDFHQRSFLYGPPPKVIWIRRGNCSTPAIERMLREHHVDILAFLADPEAAFLALA